MFPSPPALLSARRVLGAEGARGKEQYLEMQGSGWEHGVRSTGLDSNPTLGRGTCLLRASVSPRVRPVLLVAGPEMQLCSACSQQRHVQRMPAAGAAGGGGPVCSPGMAGAAAGQQKGESSPIQEGGWQLRAPPHPGGADCHSEDLRSCEGAIGTGDQLGPLDGHRWVLGAPWASFCGC